MIDRRTFTGGVFIAGASGLLGCSNAETERVTPDLPNSRATIRTPSPEELAKEGPLGDRFLGSVNAPGTVYEYVSLTCPFSRKFHIETYPRFKKDYIDAGKARLVVREFPIGRSAAAAAVVARQVGMSREAFDVAMTALCGSSCAAANWAGPERRRSSAMERNAVAS